MTTAAAVEPKAPSHFHARYREPHPLAGYEVERGRECGCGRWFPQWAVSKKYLSDRPGARKSFLESCEIERLTKGEIAWHPKRCWRCERRTLTAPPI